jgi:Cysteine sulfinate desulfinase/cysteine desulfurase and related enzymes
MIYFDNSATTKVNDSVLQTYNAASQEYFGNPSSLHKLGLKAYELLETSRKQIANLMGFKQDEVVFTVVVLRGTTGSSKELLLRNVNLVSILLLLQSSIHR